MTDVNERNNGEGDDVRRRKASEHTITLLEIVVVVGRLNVAEMGNDGHQNQEEKAILVHRLVKRARRANLYALGSGVYLHFVEANTISIGRSARRH